MLEKVLFSFQCSLKPLFLVGLFSCYFRLDCNAGMYPFNFDISNKLDIVKKAFFSLKATKGRFFQAKLFSVTSISLSVYRIICTDRLDFMSFIKKVS